MRIILAISCLLFSVQAVAVTMHLTSLDWPPFSGRSLAGQGAVIERVRQALLTQDIELKVDFYPWSRAVWLTRQNNRYVGYIPEYEFDTDDYVFSDSIGSSPLVLIHPKGQGFAYQEPRDLIGKRIGVVQDYINTAEIDALIATQKITTEVVTSDIANIRKVAAGRLDAALIDLNVLNYWLSNDESLMALEDDIEVNPVTVETKHLFVAFARSKRGKYWAQMLNQGLEQVAQTSRLNNSEIPIQLNR